MKHSITTIRNENLEDVKFNVKECRLLYCPNTLPKADTSFSDPTQAQDFKGIVNDEGHLISIVKKNYKLVSNRQVIDTVFDRLIEAGIDYTVDPIHSYYNDQRMRLHITLPELSLHDSDSEIPLSLYINNSYNQSEGIRIMWGAFMIVCSNGMIVGKMLESFYHRHTKGFYLPHMRETFDNAYKKIPAINDRIKLLEQEKFTEENFEDTEKIFGEKFLKKAIESIDPINLSIITESQKVNYQDVNDILINQTKWFVINLITYYISHSVSMLQRQTLQTKLTKLTGI